MISVILPVVRPEQANVVVELIKERAGIECEIITDIDHDRIGCPKMVKKLVEQTKYDYVCFIGDDCIPLNDFLINAYNYMKDNDLYLVGLNDKTSRTLPAHWLADKKLLKHCENEEFFYTGYTHCYCDMELKDNAAKLNRYGYCTDSVVLHDHPMFTGEQTNDKDYIRVYSEKVKGKDRDLYYTRKLGYKVMTFELNCPHCQKTIEVAKELA